MFSSKGNCSNSLLKKSYCGLFVSGLAPNDGFSAFSLDVSFPVGLLSSCPISAA